MWMDNFIDVLAVVLTSLWFWGFVGAVFVATFVIAYTWMDENDRKLEELERAASERLRERMAQDGDEESILQGVYNEPEPKERIQGLMVPQDTSTHWVEKWFDYYKVSMEVDADTGKLIFTDRMHFELKNRTVRKPVSDFKDADESALRRLLIGIRSTFNRRAQRAGLITKKTRQKMQLAS